MWSRMHPVHTPVYPVATYIILCLPTVFTAYSCSYMQLHTQPLPATSMLVKVMYTSLAVLVHLSVYISFNKNTEYYCVTMNPVHKLSRDQSHVYCISKDMQNQPAVSIKLLHGSYSWPSTAVTVSYCTSIILVITH